jgi:hypothetical protein
VALSRRSFLRAWLLPIVAGSWQHVLSALSATPVKAAGSVSFGNQSAAFGALTKAGTGGLRPTGTGVLSNAQIVGGNSAGHWQIMPDGYLTPTTAGDEANLNSDPYALRITGNEGVSFTWTIATTGKDAHGRNLANAYSVASQTELKNVIPANVTPSLVQDKIILGRPGQFGDPNSTAPWPLDIDRVKPGNANRLIITSHDPKNPMILPRTRILRCDGITFTQMAWHAERWWTTLGSPTIGLIRFSLEAKNITLDKIEAWGTKNLVGEDAAANMYLLGTASPATGAENIVVQDSIFHDARYGVAGLPSNAHFIGNLLYNIAQDFIKVNAGNSNSKWNWNVMRDKTLPYNLGAGYHGDFIQFQLVGMKSDLTDVEVIGNRGIIGANGDCWDLQGIFLDNAHPGPGKCRRIHIKGNAMLGGLVRQGSIGTNADSGWEDIFIIGNTFVRDKRQAGNGNTRSIIVQGKGHTGIVIKNNVAEAVAGVSAIVQTSKNNVSLGQNGNTVAFAKAFAGTTDEKFSPTSIAAFMTNFTLRSGGPLDTARPKIGAIGSGYVDYEARTINSDFE